MFTKRRKGKRAKIRHGDCLHGAKIWGILTLIPRAACRYNISVDISPEDLWHLSSEQGLGGKLMHTLLTGALALPIAN